MCLGDEAGGAGRGGRVMRLWCGFCAHSVIHTPMYLEARMRLVAGNEELQN